MPLRSAPTTANVLGHGESDNAGIVRLTLPRPVNLTLTRPAAPIKVCATQGFVVITVSMKNRPREHDHVPTSASSASMPPRSAATSDVAWFLRIRATRID